MNANDQNENDYSSKKNIPPIYVRSIKLTIAAFLLTAMILLGPISIQQQQQQQTDRWQQSQNGYPIHEKEMGDSLRVVSNFFSIILFT